MANNPEAKITVKMFNDDFKKGANELKKESADISREFKLQSEQMKLTASETEKLEAKMDFLTKKQDIAKKSVQEHEQAYEQAKEMFGENSKAAEDMAKKLDNAKIEEAKLANEVELTNRALQSQQSEAEKTSSKFDEMGDKIKDVGSKMKDVGDGMTDAGLRMTAGVTAPILGVAAAAKGAWEEVDDGLDTIVSKTGATGEALASLEESFYNVAKNNKFTFQQVGDAIGEVNTQFGLTGTALDEATVQMLRFADINEADVAGSAIKSKQAMSMFSLEADQVGMVLDSVTKAAQNSGQSTDKLFEVVTKGAPQLQAMGLDFAQSVEVMGQFEQSGVDSGTAMGYLAKAQVVFAKEGVTLQDGLEKTVDKIKNAKTETEAMTTAAAVFGTKGASKMVAAIKDGSFEFEQFANATSDAAGSVDSTFEGMEDPIDNVATAMNILKIAASDLFGQLQEILLPIGLKLIEMLQGALEWFSGLSDGMKKTIIVVLGIAAAIGPLLGWLGLLVSSVGSIVTGFGTLLPILAKLGPIFTVVRTAITALTGPIGIVIAIVIALGIVIYKNWDAIKEYTVNAFTVVKDFLSDTWTWIKDTTVSVFNGIVDFFKKWGSTILIILGGPIAILIALIVKNWDSIKDTTTKVFTSIKDFLAKIWDGIKTTVVNLVVGMVKGAVERFNSLKSTISTVFNAIKTVASTIWSAIKTAIMTPVDSAKNLASTAFETLKNTATTAFNNLKTSAKTIFDAIKTAITSPIETAKTTVLGIIDTIKNGFKNMKITIPKPKLPKVNVSMGTKKVLGAEIPFPKFDIEWFKKGGVFNKKVIAGNAGFGDVAEAIVPFEGGHADRIAGLVAKAQNKLAESGAAVAQSVKPMYITVVSQLDGQEVARNQYSYLDGMMTDDYNVRGAVHGV